jgi:hypothetical protein
MSKEKSTLVIETVLFKKIGEGLDISEGTLELYNDSLVLNPHWKGQFEGGIREEPMTSGENMPFSNIIQITGVVKGLLFKLRKYGFKQKLTSLGRLGQARRSTPLC